MSKQDPAAQPTTAMSPYLSLREAIRPAISAYSLLAREQKRAGALVDECNNLLHATHEVLKRSALVHLLAPEPGHQLPDDLSGDRREQLLDTYANVGMLWAKVIGSSMLLGDLLLEQKRLDDARQLAASLENVGEHGVAKALNKRIDDAATASIRKQIGSFHSNMTKEEIKGAIDILRGMPGDFPEREHFIAVALAPIAESMKRNFGDNGPWTNYGYITRNGSPEAGVSERLMKVSLEFEQRYQEKSEKTN